MFNGPLASFQVAVPDETGTPSAFVARDLAIALIQRGARPRRLPNRPIVGRVRAKLRVASPWIHSRGPVFVPVMGQRFGELYFASQWGPVIPFCWDVWQPDWERWSAMLVALRPKVVFATAETSARFLADELAAQVFHAPEATALERYAPSPSPMAGRPIHVLEMGRRFADWHEPVTTALLARGYRHLYERLPGATIFPTLSELHAGLGKSAVSVCFPSSMTHRQRSGDVETLTHRYLESFASGCLVVGHAPMELVRMFGYNPVVEADMTNPAGQILYILSNLDRYQALVERNHDAVRRLGSWAKRVDDIIDSLKGSVYDGLLDAVEV